MSIRFNASEVLEMAQQIERNGARFYRKAADHARDDAPRRLLLRLASMEDEHQQYFASMRAGVSEDESEPWLLDPQGSASRYLQAMADGFVFDVRTDPIERLSGREGMELILRTALDLEKDSIVFYSGMRLLVPPRLGQGRIDDIIKEELDHVALLSAELSTLKQN